MLAALLGAVSRLALRKVLLSKSPAVIATILALVLASGTAHAQQGRAASLALEGRAAQ